MVYFYIRFFSGSYLRLYFRKTKVYLRKRKIGFGDSDFNVGG